MTMAKVLELLHLAELAALLKERVGLDVRPMGYGALQIALAARFEELDGAFHEPEAYLRLLRSEAGDEELRQLLPLVTVGKTSFFRDERQFAALSLLMPDLLSRRRAVGRRVSAWSAGCATGEEVYSIAITAAEAGSRPDDLELLGTDVNSVAVAAAARGLFESRRVRDVRAELVQRYFEPEGDGYRVRGELRRLLGAVKAHNLVSKTYPRPRIGGWDLIFCRNVIIYFDTHTTQQVLARLHEVLAPGGYLFLGYSESLFRLFDGFELVEVAGAFFYRRPPKERRPVPSAPPRPAAAHRHITVRKHLHLPPPPPAPPLDSGPASRETEAEPLLSPQEALDGAVEMLEDGRFGAARDLLERVLAQLGEDLALRLTLANLYGTLRQPDRARESYQAALLLEPLSAEAHLFYGIERLTQGDADGAALELSRALFLDPDLALGHYYLGRCREAQRDVRRARLSYKNAIDAYQRQPDGKRQVFLGYYPDLPENGGTFARAAEYALAAL